MKTCITTSPLLAGRRCSRAKIVFTRLLLVSAFCCLAMPARAVYRDWTGAASGNWSNPSNWNPAGVPQAGESLRFSNGGNTSMINDIPNLIVNGLGFFDHDWVLSGNPLTLAGPGGNGILVLGGTGYSSFVTINCALILYTNNCELRCDALDGSFGRLRINADINLNGFDLLLYASSKSFPADGVGRIEMAGSISGNGNVTARADAYPDGTVAFLGTADNTFTGTLFIEPKASGPSDGVFFNKLGGSVVNNRLVIRYGAYVYWRNSNQIGDNTTVVISDGSRMDLNGYNETIGNLVLTNVHADADASLVDTVGGFLDVVGTLTVNDGIVSWVDNASIVATIRGILNLPGGNHNFFVSAANYDGLNLEAKVTGAGGFTKFGNAALLLKGTNTFGGTVYGGSGIIDVHNPSGFGSPAGGVELIGGSVTLRNLTIASETLSARGQAFITAETAGSLLFAAGTAAWTGSIQLETNLVVSGGDMILSGPISGAGGLDFRTFGTAQLGGGAANTYTGKTLVRCPLLQLNKPFGVNAFAGPMEVGGGAGGPYEVEWLNSYLAPNTSLTLFANGVVNLNDQVDNFGPVIFNGGSIQTGAGFFIAENTITANPATTTATINGNLSLGVNPAYFVVSNGVADPDLWVNAIIAGANLRKQGPGTLLFTAPNTYVGQTTVEDGILHADNPVALGTTGGNTVVAAGGTVRLGGNDGMDEAFQLNGAGFQGTHGALQVVGVANIYGGVSLNSPSTINTLPAGSLAIYSVINGNGPLTKTGSGNLFLSGTANNSYTGGTIVSAGTLFLSKSQGIIAAPGNLTIGPATVSSPAIARFFQTANMSGTATVTVNAESLLDLNGYNQTIAQLNLNDGGDAQSGTGTLGIIGGGMISVGSLSPSGSAASSSITGNLGVAPNDVLGFSVAPFASPSSAPELDVSASIYANGFENPNFFPAGIFKLGAGQMRLAGNSTFGGPADVYEGTVIVEAAGALGTTLGATYLYGGSTLALVGGVLGLSVNGETLVLNTTNLPGLENRAGHNTWTGPVSLSRDSSIGVNPGWSFSVQGAVSGSGSLTKLGGGLLRLGGSANNTHSGNTYVDAGTLYLTKFPGIQAVPANLIIGRPAGGSSATVMHVNSDLIWGNITVNNGGLLNVNGYTEYIGNLTLNGGGDVQTGAGTLHITSLAVNPGSFADQSVISGQIGLNSGSVPFAIGSGSLGVGVAHCQISATISHSSHTANLQKTGAGLLQLTGNNTYNGNTTVSSGTLQIDGLQPQSPVQVFGGRLQGSGTVGHVIFDESKCFLAPGSSPGILTTSNLNATALGGAKVEIELNGPGAGSGYDQINVRGTVNLSQLGLGASLGFASSVGQQFTIINNDGADAVSGTFAGLPQNKKLYVGGELFQISYSGGTGNDVVLNRLVTPPPPTLTIERIPPASVRLIWATNDPAFRLQSNTNLTALTWISASPPPVVIGTNSVLTNTISGAQNFYRLVNP